uniref:Uncharacterized protein n=1 Tax=Latimeria chalumnae TaxID=7897 RepID=H2ZXP3_LATCH
MDSDIWNLVRMECTGLFSAMNRDLGSANVDELKVLKRLRKNPDVTLKADKGGATVVMNKLDYVAKTMELLGDMRTYRILQKDPTKSITNKVVNKILDLKRQDKFCIGEYGRVYPCAPVSPRFYGLPKIHKEGNPLRPIVSNIGSPTYALAKYLCIIISPLVNNSTCTVKNSYV